MSEKRKQCDDCQQIRTNFSVCIAGEFPISVSLKWRPSEPGSNTGKEQRSGYTNI